MIVELLRGWITLIPVFLWIEIKDGKKWDFEKPWVSRTLLVSIFWPVHLGVEIIDMIVRAVEK